MAAHGVMITNDVVVTWDGGPVRLFRGQVLDSPNGGALLTAIGGGNFVVLTAQQQGGNPGPDAAEWSGGANLSGNPSNTGQN